MSDIDPFISLTFGPAAILIDGKEVGLTASHIQFEPSVPVALPDFGAVSMPELQSFSFEMSCRWEPGALRFLLHGVRDCRPRCRVLKRLRRR